MNSMPLPPDTILVVLVLGAVSLENKENTHGSYLDSIYIFCSAHRAVAINFCKGPEDTRREGWSLSTAITPLQIEK